MTSKHSLCLLQLDNDVLRELFTVWLTPYDIVLLDSACCNITCRRELMLYFKNTGLALNIPLLKENDHRIDKVSMYNWFSKRCIYLSSLFVDNDTSEFLEFQNSLLKLQYLCVSFVRQGSSNFQKYADIFATIKSLELKSDCSFLLNNLVKQSMQDILAISPQLQDFSCSDNEVFTEKEQLTNLLLDRQRTNPWKSLSLPHGRFDIKTVLHSIDSPFQSLVELRTTHTYDLFFDIESFTTTTDDNTSLCKSERPFVSIPLASLHSSLENVSILAPHMSNSESPIILSVGTIIPIISSGFPALLKILQTHFLSELFAVSSNIGHKLQSLTMNFAYFHCINIQESFAGKFYYPSRAFASTQHSNLVSSTSCTTLDDCVNQYFHPNNEQAVAATGQESHPATVTTRNDKQNETQFSFFAQCPQLQSLTLDLANHPLQTWQFSPRGPAMAALQSNPQDLQQQRQITELLTWSLFLSDIPVYLSQLRSLHIVRSSKLENWVNPAAKVNLNEMSDKHVWSFSKNLAKGCPLLETLEVESFPLDITQLYGLQHLRCLTVKKLSTVLTTGEDKFPYYPATYQRFQPESEVNNDEDDHPDHEDATSKFATKNNRIIVEVGFPALTSVTLQDTSQTALYRLIEIVSCGVAPRLRRLSVTGLGPSYRHRHFWPSDLRRNEDDCDYDDAYIYDENDELNDEEDYEVRRWDDLFEYSSYTAQEGGPSKYLEYQRIQHSECLKRAQVSNNIDTVDYAFVLTNLHHIRVAHISMFTAATLHRRLSLPHRLQMLLFQYFHEKGSPYLTTIRLFPNHSYE